MKQTLQELTQSKTLKFIFVGGKGGVGKTTTSSSIAIELAKTRGKTLIISTDPAHNLSDAFNQQFTHEPTKVKGLDNLFAIEIDPKKQIDIQSSFFDNQKILEGQGNPFSFLNELFAGIPGIDEAMVFLDLLKMSQKMEANVVIFDTAPTGHTLKMLNFPNIMQKGLEKIMAFKDKINGVFSMFNMKDNSIDNIFTKMQDMKKKTEDLKKIMMNPELTTFVAVCIPEFLSVYETERLVQTLAVQNIDIYNVVVNQIVLFDEKEQCRKCKARYKMQFKYISQIKELYEDFHCVFMPLEDEEIRGLEKLKNYSQKLLQEKILPKLN